MQIQQYMAQAKQKKAKSRMNENGGKFF